jgi:hypothetical protein
MRHSFVSLTALLLAPLRGLVATSIEFEARPGELNRSRSCAPSKVL